MAAGPVAEVAVEVFSPLWWFTSGTSLALAVLSLLGIRFLTAHQRTLYAKGLGWGLILWMVLPPVANAFAGHWHVSYGLPLQWCDFTGGLAGLALITRRQLLYEISLFWGLTGAAAALVTPTLTQGTDWFFLAEFFISHAMLISAPVFLTLYASMRPRRWSWLGSVGWLNVVGLGVLVLDYLIDANYMFLISAPPRDIAVYRIQWPGYLIGFDAACVVAFALIYLPFRYVGRHQGRDTRWTAGEIPPRAIP
jgi:hypothetical integral membrane protein (TIGR02206 family)